MDLSRRSWLKGVGLMSSLVAIGSITNPSIERRKIENSDQDR